MLDQTFERIEHENGGWVLRGFIVLAMLVTISYNNKTFVESLILTGWFIIPALCQTK